MKAGSHKQTTENFEEQYRQSKLILELQKQLSPDSQYFDMMLTILNKTYDTKDARGLNQLRSDIFDSILDMGLPDQRLVRNKLVEEFGLQIRRQFNWAEEECSEIVTRGRIDSNDEYRCVLQYVNDLAQDDVNLKEIEIFNAMLRAYESNKTMVEPADNED